MLGGVKSLTMVTFVLLPGKTLADRNDASTVTGMFPPGEASHGIVSYRDATPEVVNPCTCGKPSRGSYFITGCSYSVTN